MTIPTIFAYDATSKNEPILPLDVQAGGYDTGSTEIRWTQAQFDRHSMPHPAYHYDQDASASDYLSDLLDVETGAATDSEIVGWVTNARDNYRTGKRPGQRWPGIYCSENNVTGAVVVLQAAKLVNVPFVVANYSISEAEAKRRVENATGPYPAIGYQFTDLEFNGRADGNIFSVPWLTTVSVKPEENSMVTVPGMPGNWLTPPVIFSLPDHSLVAYGQGATGEVYKITRAAGATVWSAPVVQ